MSQEYNVIAGKDKQRNQEISEIGLKPTAAAFKKECIW